MLVLNAIPAALKRNLDSNETPRSSALNVKQQIIKTNAAEENAIIYSLFDDHTYLFSVLQTESDIYVLKENTGLSIQGKEIISNTNSLDRLTKREEQILKLLAQGLCAKKVAQALSISYQTVRTHQKNIYKKLSVKTLLEAVTVFNEHFSAIQ